MLANLVRSVAYTTEYTLRTPVITLASVKNGVIMVLLKVISAPLVGFSWMKIISDKEIDAFSEDTGALKVLSYNTQIPVIVGFTALHYAVVKYVKWVAEKKIRARQAAQNRGQ